MRLNQMGSKRSSLDIARAPCTGLIAGWQKDSIAEFPLRAETTQDTFVL